MITTYKETYTESWFSDHSFLVDSDEIHMLYYIIPGTLLTHLPLDKIAATLADNKFKCIFLNENDRILI